MSQLRSRKTLKTFIFIVLVTLLFYELSSTFVDRFYKDVDSVLHSASPGYRDSFTGSGDGTRHSSPGLTQNENQDQDPNATPNQYDNEKQDEDKPPKAGQGKHIYRPDGLLETNMDGPHPIYELIAKAEKEWEAKLQRASKTLEEAVAEYKKRYKRSPPKGFDVWWEFVQDNSVQLPDEYDQIHTDLEAFWGLLPSDLQQIQREAESKHDSYTIGKNTTTGAIEVLTWAFDEGRYEQLIVGSEKIVEMLQGVGEWLPDFRMVVSPHDGPNRVTDWGVRKRLLEAVESGTYVARADLPKPTPLGWLSACAPTSPARLAKTNTPLTPTTPKPKPKTFIHNHPATMDLCTHPSHLQHHGQFLSHAPGPGPAPQPVLVPEFTYCSTSVHHNIRLPVPYGWVADLDMGRGEDVEWGGKSEERMLWRGSATGIPFHVPVDIWTKAHRAKFVEETNDLEGTVSVLMGKGKTNGSSSEGRTTTGDEKEKAGLELREMKKAFVHPGLFDVAFAGNPGNGCREKRMCGVLQERYKFRERQSLREAGKYKYVMDIDGNGWSGRFKRLITSHSLIFKSTLYPEWYADRIAPWVHYVPVQLDLSDLHDTLIFFRGDGNGEGGEEELGRRIALEGREWSRAFWREEDLVAYFWRLILEYARLMSLDREAMTYDG